MAQQAWPGRLAVDIRVPYADENRNDLLRAEWVRQGGDRLPPPPLVLPRHSEGAYAVRIKLATIADLVVEDQYSDAVAGSTGGPNGHLEDRIVSHFTFQGQWRFDSARRTAVAGRGQAYIRRNDEPWNFTVARGTHALMLSVPIEEVRLRKNQTGVPGELDSPAVRLLLAHVRTCLEIGDGVNVAARNAALELFRGLLRQQVIDDEHVYSALVRAAKDRIDERLLTDPGLDPSAVADELHVSVRTLHRAFAQEQATVMGYVRQRRLERVAAELAATSWTVAELAARWHFTDESHLGKAYRKQFGETPAARRRALLALDGRGRRSRGSADAGDSVHPTPAPPHPAENSPRSTHTPPPGTP
jgi:AraC-like DNA-binding protein